MDELLENTFALPNVLTPTLETALWLARLCHVTALADSILRIAQDRLSPLGARREAIVSLGRLMDGTRRRALLEIARGFEEDESDELKGAALDALWPRLDEMAPGGRAIVLEEMLSCLGTRRDRSFYGAYWLFVSSLPQRLTDSEWPSVLEWLTNELRAIRDDHEKWWSHLWEFDELLVEAFLRTARLLPKEDAARIMARVSMELMLGHKSPIPGDDRKVTLALDDGQRIALVDAIIDEWCQRKMEGRDVAFRLVNDDRRPPLATIRDWPAISARAATDNAAQVAWLQRFPIMLSHL